VILLVNPIVLVALVGGAIVVIGSGALDGIVGKLKDSFPSGGGGGGSAVETTVITTGGLTQDPREFVTDPTRGSVEGSLSPIPVGDGSLIIGTPKVDPRGISQKEQESLFRFRNEQRPDSTLEQDVAFFRRLQEEQLSQTSLGTSVILSEADIARTVSKQLTRQQQADIEALDARRAGSDLKLSGADTVLLKALEAERAKIGVLSCLVVTEVVALTTSNCGLIIALFLIATSIISPVGLRPVIIVFPRLSVFSCNLVNP